jgi:hypothetical protein
MPCRVATTRVDPGASIQSKDRGLFTIPLHARHNLRQIMHPYDLECRGIRSTGSMAIQTADRGLDPVLTVFPAYRIMGEHTG